MPHPEDKTSRCSLGVTEHSGSCQTAGCIHISHTNTLTTPAIPATPAHGSPTAQLYCQSTNVENTEQSWPSPPKAAQEPHPAPGILPTSCAGPARVHSADSCRHPRLSPPEICSKPTCSKHLWRQGHLPRTVRELVDTHTQPRSFIHSLILPILPSIPGAQLLPRATYFRFSQLLATFVKLCHFYLQYAVCHLSNEPTEKGTEPHAHTKYHSYMPREHHSTAVQWEHNSA